jgi:hypothetical protein
VVIGGGNLPRYMALISVFLVNLKEKQFWKHSAKIWDNCAKGICTVRLDLTTYSNPL